MKLRLYHYWRSSSSWRVRWALALKSIPCEWVAVNLLSDEPESPAHLERNPLGYVPVLELLDSSLPPSGRFLAESMAIIEWLEETQPTPTLLPGTPLERARIRQMAEIINSGIQPLQNLNTSTHHSSDVDEQKRWNQYWIQRGLQAYETCVQKIAGKFSFENELTLADLFLIPQCYNAIRQGVSLEAYPIIFRIYQTALRTESCQASSPERYS